MTTAEKTAFVWGADETTDQVAARLASWMAGRILWDYDDDGVFPDQHDIEEIELDCTDVAVSMDAVIPLRIDELANVPMPRSLIARFATGPRREIPRYVGDSLDVRLMAELTSYETRSVRVGLSTRTGRFATYEVRLVHPNA